MPCSSLPCLVKLIAANAVAIESGPRHTQRHLKWYQVWAYLSLAHEDDTVTD
jgi:hypothetical protein